MAKRSYTGKPLSAKMTASEYRAAIEALGLNQQAAGRFLGVSPRTAQNWPLGTAPIPLAVAKLLRLMLRLKLDPADLE